LTAFFIEAIELQQISTIILFTIDVFIRHLDASHYKNQQQISQLLK